MVSALQIRKASFHKARRVTVDLVGESIYATVRGMSAGWYLVLMDQPLSPTSARLVQPESGLVAELLTTLCFTAGKGKRKINNNNINLYSKHINL